MEQTRTVEDQKPTSLETGSRPSVLAILCVFCASLGMLFFPAVVAIPMGIYALKFINESEGRLSGRQMAVTDRQRWDLTQNSFGIFQKKPQFGALKIVSAFSKQSMWIPY